MNLRKLKTKIKNLSSDTVQVYVVAICWIGLFVALMIYGATHPSPVKRELPKTFHREWSGKFY